MKVTPRGWQGIALPIVLESLRRGGPSLVCAATGSGKSIFLGLLLDDVLRTLREGVVVVLVPTEALVAQLAATLEMVTGQAIGQWYGRRKKVETVTVCCLPSLESLTLELTARGLKVSLLVADEAHRLEAYEDALTALAPRVRLGLTATPYRARTGLSLWPEVTYRYSMAQAIAAGDLVPPDVRYWRGEESVTDAVIQMYRLHAEGPGVVSASDIPDAIHTAEVLTEAGIVSEAIHSQLPKARREELISKLKHGDLAALVHVRVLSEGVDLPWLRWLALRTRIGRNRVGLVQEVGRVLRTYPGKTRGLVLDPLALTHPKQGVGLDHSPDLVSWADEEEAGPRVASDAKQREELERIEALSVAISEQEEWLVNAAWRKLGGSPVTIRDVSAPLTERQREAIERRRKSSRWLAPGTREEVQLLLQHPEQLTRGGASALIGTLAAAAQGAAKHRQSGGSWTTAPRLDLGERET